MEDTLTITLNDKVAKQLRKIIFDEVSTKKLDIWLLKQEKTELQAKLTDINDKLEELRK